MQLCKVSQCHSSFSLHLHFVWKSLKKNLKNSDAKHWEKVLAANKFSLSIASQSPNILLPVWLGQRARSVAAMRLFMPITAPVQGTLTRTKALPVQCKWSMWKKFFVDSLILGHIATHVINWDQCNIHCSYRVFPCFQQDTNPLSLNSSNLVALT